ncbi:Ubiquinone biosynthesis O-methyltransferase [Planctomycetes bacterium MalM25]|nr:Ubiquinone biosynthesis O-methyltransferase [Planctomycetes bacterium MalM25]
MADPMPVRSGYDRWARVYDHDANPMQALEEPVVIHETGPVAGLRVLDLGCGTGRHALRMAAEGAAVTAVDFSEAMLDEAKRKPNAERVRFVTHDLRESLPFDSEFDLVVCGLVLEHVKDLSAFYQEVFRVVGRSGRVVVSFMHSAMFARGSQARFTDPQTDELIEVESAPYTVSEAVMAALAAGFTIKNLSEHSPDPAFAERFPRAEKYVGWPMLVVQHLSKG